MIGTAFSEEMETVCDRLRQATVQVRSGQSGAGSGVIWSAEGLIITNAHVVTGHTVEVELFDRRVLPATPIVRNAQRDLAALQIDATHLPTVEVGDSDRIRVGEFVMAIGNPLGMVGALTTGIIHTVSSTSRQPWVQADIQLAPGNSGGALANAQGQVIGINAMIVNGRGFAVPSNVVQWFLNKVDRPYLGVMLNPVMVLVKKRPAYGLLITAVEAGSPAEAAHLQRGDILIGVRGTLFQTSDELFHVLEYSHSGDGLPLDFLRDGKQRTVEAELYSRSFDQVKAA